MNSLHSLIKRAAVAILLASSVVFGPATVAANPPAGANNPASSAKAATAETAEYVPLGTASFGPNDHGSYAWFIEVKTRQVVMCLVHNPQSPIECKRAPMPPP